MAKKDYTKQFKQALRNLKKRISYQRAKGFTVKESDVIPQNLDPSAKSIKKLNKIRAKQIQKQVEFPDLETGVALKGKEAIKAQKEYAQQLNEEPVIDYVSAIETMIKELPDVRYTDKGVLHTAGMKDKMLSALYDTLAEYDSKSEYDKYLGNNFYDIQEDFGVIRLDSNQDRIWGSFGKSLAKIQGKALTPEESRSIAEYVENY